MGAEPRIHKHHGSLHSNRTGTSAIWHT